MIAKSYQAFSYSDWILTINKLKTIFMNFVVWMYYYELHTINSIIKCNDNDNLNFKVGNKLFIA